MAVHGRPPTCQLAFSSTMCRLSSSPASVHSHRARALHGHSHRPEHAAGWSGRPHNSGAPSDPGDGVATPAAALLSSWPRAGSDPSWGRGWQAAGTRCNQPISGWPGWLAAAAGPSGRMVAGQCWQGTDARPHWQGSCAGPGCCSHASSCAVAAASGTRQLPSALLRWHRPRQQLCPGGTPNSTPVDGQ